MLCKSQMMIERQALNWNPQTVQKRGIKNNMGGARVAEKMWGELKTMA